MEGEAKATKKQMEMARQGLSPGKKVAVNIILAVILGLFLFPIVWMGVISFKSQEQIQTMELAQQRRGELAQKELISKGMFGWIWK